MRDTAVRSTIDHLFAPLLFLRRQTVDQAFFQNPHVQLTQTRIANHFAATGFGDDLRGAARAPQIAGNDMRNAFFADAPGDQTGLVFTHGG